MNVRVDLRSSFSLVGTILKWIAVPLMLPLGLAVYHGSDVGVFVVTTAVTLGLGMGMELLETEPELGIREAFLLVSATWLFVAAVGALPYVLAGRGSVADPMNALFESMSGFTTTGATVMSEISTRFHSPALMMWRQLSQWLGGMGIVVLAVAILPKLSIGGTQLMQAEAPGPDVERLAPRIVETARRLWLIYLALTLFEVVVLYGLHLMDWAPQMGMYNAVAHALTTMPTGGFSPEARSIEAFSDAVQWTIIPFMFLAGTNFALVWRFLTGKPRQLFRDGEFRTYGALIALTTALLVVILVLQNVFPDLEASLRHGLFQILAIVTTTGFASTDFNLWGGVATTLLFLTMFLGGCAGSTGGGIKVVRWLVGAKAIWREFVSTVHPRAVRPIRFGDRVLPERNVRQIVIMILCYFLLILLGTGLVEADAVRVGQQTGTLDVLSTVASCLGNIGPGFGIVGPMNNYLSYSYLSKGILIVLMWIGRLEIFTVLILIVPSYWRH